MTGAKGFTLIELMITFTIIGILAAIAIPAYQHYAVRAKVTEGLLLADPARQVVAERYMVNGIYPNNNAEAGLPDPADISSRIVGSVEVVDDGVIIITFSEPDLMSGALRLIPAATAGRVSWRCTTSLPNVLVPSICR